MLHKFFYISLYNSIYYQNFLKFKFPYKLYVVKVKKQVTVKLVFIEKLKKNQIYHFIKILFKLFHITNKSHFYLYDYYYSAIP